MKRTARETLEAYVDRFRGTITTVHLTDGDVERWAPEMERALAGEREPLTDAEIHGAEDAELLTSAEVMS